MVTLDEILDLILFGDIYEQPLSIIEDKINIDNENDFDKEQFIRACIAATIKERFGRKAMLEILKDRGFNEEEYHNALIEENEDKITLTHPSNWMSEQEVEEYNLCKDIYNVRPYGVKFKMEDYSD